MLRNKKAISPVISALLLIILAVAAGVIAYAYVMGWLGSATKASSVEYGELSLDSATASAGGNIVAYVRNLGGKPVTPDKAYVDGSQSTVSPTTAIAVNTVAALTITPSSTLVANTVYEVKVVCTDGTSLVFSVKAI